MKKYLLVATVVKIHVNVFHIPTLKMMKEQGYEVHVASHNDYATPTDMYIPYCDKFIEIPFERSPFKMSNLKAYRMLRELFDEEKYDIIHAHTPVGGALSRLAAKNTRRNGTKVLYTAHGFHFYSGAPLKNWLLFYPVERILSKYTDTLITINKEDYRRAKEFSMAQVEHVPGVGIDLSKIEVDNNRVKKLKKKLKIKPNDFILVSIGELNKNKNHEIVLEALDTFKDNKNIKYLIVGEGELKEELAIKAKEYNLEEQVMFLGFRNDIYELLDIADLFIFPSFREGLSKSLMEAMAMGKPVIASDIRGNRDLIDKNRGGYLISPTNYVDLSNYIRIFLKNPKLAVEMGNYNLKKINCFSMELVQQRHKEIYVN